MKKLPTTCPSCAERLTVRRLRCSACDTEVEGTYPLPPLSRLTPEEQTFALQFIKASGSLKEMAKQLKISYPTVRNRLNDLIDRIQTTETEAEENNE